MSRAHRTHVPGAAFHITALTQGRKRWFTGALADTIADYIYEAALSCSTPVIAFGVMPSHLHIVVRQRVRPLGWIMQRILQRTALLVRRTYNHKGHVFGSRFWSGACDSPQYLRQAIIYTHLNPYYAHLCREPDQYKWTSHREYLGLDHTFGAPICVDHGLRLFASDDEESEQALRRNYMRFIAYWMGKPERPLGSRYIFTAEELIAAPTANAGDSYWSTEYGDVVFPPTHCVAATVDVRDRAITALRALAKNVTLDQIRTCGRVKGLGAVRRELIAMLLIGGCRNGAIARCLNVSHAHVSGVAATLRFAKQPKDIESGRS